MKETQVKFLDESNRLYIVHGLYNEEEGKTRITPDDANRELERFLRE
ncbi:MAG: hypothetical protein ACD_50C00311G0002 [uncultured bacterium]|nr:MAG: hypothetical protein ACD_50C00311G0002 [uncultured bacterium]